MPFTRIHNLQHNTADIPGEHELQTDIMRFLAILALCLMAVFALVQSLPLTSISAAQETASPEDPSAPLEQRIADLRQTIEQLSAQQVNAEQALQALQDAQGQAERELAQSLAQLRDSRHQQNAGAAQLSVIDAELKHKKSELDALAQQVAAEAERLAQTQGRVSQLSRELAQRQSAQTRTSIAVNRPPARAKTPLAVPPAPQAAPVSDPQPEGFSLRFASEPALRSLVASGHIGFFSRQPEGFWQLSLQGARGRFKRSEAPPAYYEMTAGTVPLSFKQALIRSSGVAASPQTVWGVTLPAGMERRVQQLMQANRGGTLVIQANGQVLLDRSRRS
jgi:hypothetical protein